MTSIYDIFKNSAMRKAVAPSTGGEMIAPIPPAASNPPADSLSYPALERSGQEAERRVTLSPRPNLTARREGTMPESPCVPPPPAYRWSLTEKSRHRTARPLIFQHGTIDREEMMNVTVTSNGTPKMPSRVMTATVGRIEPVVRRLASRTNRIVSAPKV